MSDTCAYNPRLPLHEVLPLDTPFTLIFSPATVCNIRCKYCFHSKPNPFPDEKKTMSLDLFKKCIDDASAFPNRIKNITFCGFGEPLVCPHVAEMVRYAKLSGVVDYFQIITNGLPLHRELSQALIDAGLDMLRISMQGLDAQTYQDICGAKIDFDRLLDELAWFSQQKKQCRLHVKMIDVACPDRESRDRFHELFDPIADVATIQHYSGIVPNKGEEIFDRNEDKTIYGQNLCRIEICPVPFYNLMIMPSGRVWPCYNPVPPLVLGDVTRQSLLEIWNHPSRHELLLAGLQDRNNVPICCDCPQPNYQIRESDILDPFRDELIQRFQR